MRDIFPLPGDGCRHWCRGRCLYEEHLNPGLELGYACSAMQRIEQRFDDFVVRGEILGVTAEEAGRIWQHRVAQALCKGWDCPDYEDLLDDTGELLCRHFEDGLCLHLLPACPGRCRKFALPER